MKKITLSLKTASLLIPLIFIFHTSLYGSWEKLERYESDNEQLLVSGLKKENRVVFLGDSITDFWVPNRPTFWSNHPFIGRGISGQTTGQMLLRFRADVINLNPSKVIILAGTNDLAENQGPTTYERILNNLKSMADLAQKNGIEVIFATVLPAKDYYWKPGLSPDIKIPELNEKLTAYCESQGITVIDFFPAMVNEAGDAMRSDLSEDGVHPNKKGYAIMEPLVLAAIQEQ